MAAKQQLAPQWASLFRFRQHYYIYNECQCFIQDFSYDKVSVTLGTQPKRNVFGAEPPRRDLHFATGQGKGGG
jgi:hypothetical protein